MRYVLATRDFALGALRGVRGDLLALDGAEPSTDVLRAVGCVPLDPGTFAELQREANAARTAAKPRAAWSVLVREAAITHAARGED